MDIIILHGTKGSPNGNWFPWLKKECEKLGHSVFIPKFPTPENQSVENWCKELDKQAPVFGKDTILIGHSCGATYLLHILEVLKIPVFNSILVSSFIEKLNISEFDELNKTFINHNFNWEKIKINSKKFHIFHGDNDPYVPLKYAEKISKKLKTPIHIIKNGGHLNSESNYNEFPELLEILF